MAIVNPPCTAAIAAVRFSGVEMLTATAMLNPKNGACIVADNSLETSSISKLGAVAAITLLTTKIPMNTMSNLLVENFIVIIRKIGPNTATPNAYTLSSSPVVEIGTSKSFEN